MKNLSRFMALIALATTFAANFATAQPLIVVDEFGNGTFNGNPLPSTIAVEPISGLATLQYTLPFNGTRGDVVLLDPGPVPQPVGDVLRFDGNFSLYFFSERESSDVFPFDPADGTQLPGPFAGYPSIVMQEVGPEGNNGALYVPNPGDPGYQNGIVGLKYQFISDVPEPGTGVLMILGVAILGSRKWLGNGRHS